MPRWNHHDWPVVHKTSGAVIMDDACRRGQAVIITNAAFTLGEAVIRVFPDLPRAAKSSTSIWSRCRTSKRCGRASAVIFDEKPNCCFQVWREKDQSVYFDYRWTEAARDVRPRAGF